MMPDGFNPIQILSQHIRDHQAEDDKRFSAIDEKLDKIWKWQYKTTVAVLMLLLSICGYLLTHGEFTFFHT